VEVLTPLWVVGGYVRCIESGRRELSSMVCKVYILHVTAVATSRTLHVPPVEFSLEPPVTWGAWAEPRSRCRPRCAG
jgi:hypothetical protein